MTMLSVCNDAIDMLTQPRKSAIFGVSGDVQCRLFQVLLRAVGRDLCNLHDWSFLQGTESFTCEATNAQTGQPVDGFVRMQEDSIMYNDTRDWRVFGPTSSEEWSDLIVRTISTLNQYWRIINGQLHIYSPNEGDTIRYEYVTNAWIYRASDSLQVTELTSDLDTFVFDEWLLTLGLCWQWKRNIGLDYAEEMITYQREVADRIKADRGSTTRYTTDNLRRFYPKRTWGGTVSDAP